MSCLKTRISVPLPTGAILWALSGLVSTPLHAQVPAPITFETETFVKVVVPTVIDGKAVHSVGAQVGIIFERHDADAQPQPALDWRPSQSVVMSQIGDQFFAKVRLKSSTTTRDLDHEKGPAVRYWIFFEEGTTTETPIEFLTLRPRVQVSSTDAEVLRQERIEMIKDFDSPELPPKTRASALVVRYAPESKIPDPEIPRP